MADEIWFGAAQDSYIALQKFTYLGGGSWVPANPAPFYIPYVYDPVTGFAIADFDGDSKLDAAVAIANFVCVVSDIESKTPGMLYDASVCATKGGGSTPLQGAQLLDLAVADMDGDGHPDIVTIDNRPVAGGGVPNLQVVYNATVNSGQYDWNTVNRALAPYPLVRWNEPLNSSGQRLVVADLDGDGLKDDVALVADKGKYLHVILQSGGGVVESKPLLSFGGAISNAVVAAADVDADGFTDLLVLDQGGQTISISLNKLQGVAGAFADGTGSSITEALVHQGVGPQDIVAAPFRERACGGHIPADVALSRQEDGVSDRIDVFFTKQCVLAAPLRIGARRAGGRLLGRRCARIGDRRAWGRRRPGGLCDHRAGPVGPGPLTAAMRRSCQRR